MVPKLPRLLIVILVASASVASAQAPPDSVADLSIEALEARVKAAYQIDDLENLTVATGTVAQWVESRSDEQLDALTEGQLAWLVKALTLFNYKIPNGWAVTWRGTIQAPRAGEYTFSACPIDVNSDFPKDGVYRQSMTVAVDGNQVVDVGPERWQSRGGAARLEAGEPVPIEVTYRYVFSGKESFLLKAPSVTLAWEGPGVSRSIVPSSALRVPDGTTNGLLAGYRRIDGEAEDAIGTIIEPTVDRLWLQKENLYCVNLTTQKKLIDRLWSKLTDESYLTACEAAPAGEGRTHLLVQKPNLASYLTSAQRSDFLTLLTERAGLLDALTFDDASGLYMRFRHGAETPAIEFLGAWMQQHPDLEPKIAEDYYGANRTRIRDLVIQIVFQDGQAFDALVDYVETPEGECSLPAAYTIAAGQIPRFGIEGWIEHLDEKLADEALTGDKRVNWLLARAHAEEIRWGPTQRHFYQPDNTFRGRGWIDEARLVAESDHAVFRANLESVARLVGNSQLVEANARLAELGELLSDESLKQRSNEIAESIQEIVARRRDQVEQHRAEARQSYIREVNRRLESAQARGDSALVEALQQALPRAEE